MTLLRLSALLFVVPFLYSAEQPDPKQIIRRAIEGDATDYKRARDYTYTEREQETKPNKVTSKTYEVVNLYDRDFKKLVARDDKPLPASEAAKEQAKYDKAVASLAGENAQRRAKREEESRKRMEKERAFARELPDLFRFEVIGEQSVEGRNCWIISAEPKPDAKPEDSQAKNIVKMHGKVWIEKTGYRLAKFSAQPLVPLTFGGFLARLNPGSTFEVTQMPVGEDEFWVPKQVLVHLDARFLFKKIGEDIDVRYTNYRRFGSDSRIVSVDEAEANPPGAK